MNGKKHNNIEKLLKFRQTTPRDGFKLTSSKKKRHYQQQVKQALCLRKQKYLVLSLVQTTCRFIAYVVRRQIIITSYGFRSFSAFLGGPAAHAGAAHCRRLSVEDVLFLLFAGHENS